MSEVIFATDKIVIQKYLDPQTGEKSWWLSSRDCPECIGWYAVTVDEFELKAMAEAINYALSH